MVQEDKVVYLNKFGAQGGSLAERFRQLSNRRLTAMMRFMLDQVDDALFERAEKAENNAAQNRFFDAMREVRLKRRDMEQAFEQALQNRHDRPDTPAKAPDTQGGWSLDEDSLSLVDNERLEEELAVEGMVSKAKARFAQPLGHLCERLNHSVGRTVVDEDNLPVAPVQICDAFADAMGRLEIELQPRLMVYKLFDRHVMMQLGGLYDELNKLFVEAGVLPTIKPRARTNPSGGATAPPAGRAPGGGLQGGSNLPHTPTEISDSQADALFATLQGLLSSQRGGAGEWQGHGYQPAANAMRVEDVVAALSGLQLHAEEEGAMSGYMQPVQLKQHLRRQSSGDLGRMEDDTIDIVSLLFDAILDDPNLPDTIKALIARLQIPVLKVALLDRAFFSHKQHPARRLINEMARAGIGWTDSGQVGGDPLYRRIENTVNTILENFRDDVTLFDQCLDEFQTFLAEERERTRQIEQRTRQAAEGKARVDGAREQVDRELQAMIGQRQLPRVVSRLLEDAWSKVLFITLLKEGSDGDGWRNQLEVARRLVWSVEAKSNHAERKELVAEIPGLLHDLRHGLNAIMFNPVEMTRLFKDLEREHIHVLTYTAADNATPVEPQAAAGPEEAAADSGEPGVQVPSGELQPYRERLDQAAVGTWFEFQQDNGKAIRAKLSARLAAGDRLIFVNRAGFKLADRRRDELADALRRGKVVLLDDNLLFDKALETVVSNLRNMRESHN